MKTIKLVVLFLTITFCSCKKENEETKVFTKDKINGNIQKGPFVNGTSLTLFELNANFAQTGKSFNTQILDNSGLFEIPGISLISNYAKLKADGFYFNEVSNANSQAPITLYALSDLSNKSTVNVNMLTNLELSRVEYLLSNGTNFTDAKNQAQNEILSIFSITKPDIIESELLDISQNGDDNAILLAIAIIIQGYRTESEITQLLGDMASDIRADGVLNSQSLGSVLVNDVRLMNLSTIRSNIESKYLSLGINAIIPDFEKYITIFLDSTNFIFNNYISYPYILDSKENVLADSSFNPTPGVIYSIGAFLPTGTSLKVKIKKSPGFNNNALGYLSASFNGWTFNNYLPDSTELIAYGNNQTVNVSALFGSSPSIFSYDFYIYENNATTPTRIKTITN